MNGTHQLMHTRVCIYISKIMNWISSLMLETDCLIFHLHAKQLITKVLTGRKRLPLLYIWSYNFKIYQLWTLILISCLHGTQMKENIYFLVDFWHQVLFFSSWVTPKCTFCQPFFRKTKEMSMSIRLKYGSMEKKKKIPYLYISFLLVKLWCKRRLSRYLYFPIKLCAFSSAVLYVSTCYFA